MAVFGGEIAEQLVRQLLGVAERALDVGIVAPQHTFRQPIAAMAFTAEASCWNEAYTFSYTYSLGARFSFGQIFVACWRYASSRRSARNGPQVAPPSDTIAFRPG